MAHIQQKLAIKNPSFLLNSSTIERDLVSSCPATPDANVTAAEIINEYISSSL